MSAATSEEMHTHSAARPSRSALPAARPAPWFEREWAIELIVAVVPLLSTGWAVWHHAAQGSAAAAIVFAASLLLLIGGGVLKVSRARRRDAELGRAGHPADLLGCAQVLYHAVRCGRREETRAADLRVTIHRVVRSRGAGPDRLEQLIPYVGGAGGPAGRTLPITCGIAGLAVRSGAAFVAQRTSGDYEAFRAELVESWGFRDEEARRLQPDRAAWMAIPLFEEPEGRTVAGVVYLDAREREYFGNEVQDCAIECARGIARYVEQRYGAR